MDKSLLDAALSNVHNMRTLTDEQAALLEQVPANKRSVVVQARAGSGKTFMLKQLAQRFPFSKILYVTFSKELVNEASKGGMPSNVDIKTAHSLAYGSAKKFYCPSKPLGTKEYYRKEALFEYLNEPMFDLSQASDEEDGQDYEYIYQLRQTFLDLVRYCKVNMVRPEDLEAVDEVVLYYGIPVGLERDKFYRLLAKAYKWSMSPSSNIDFTEMVHTPVYLGMDLPKYDIILADEIQDSSIMLITLYGMCLKPNGFIIGVGDDRQAIYGFAGSRNEALDMFKSKFDAETYKLTTNFRCGKNHIALAQHIVPDIVAHDQAIDGEVIEGVFDPERVQSGDLILSRTNAALVAPCLKLVKAGIKANIKGRDIAGPIATLLDKVSSGGTCDKALDILSKLEDKEMMVAQKRKYKQANIDAISDRYSITRDLLVGTDTVKDAKNKLWAIFADETPGVIFSSMHRSKGLEADRVTIIGSDRMRITRPDMLPWQHMQEANLEYVAKTRPRKILTLVPTKQNNNEESDS